MKRLLIGCLVLTLVFATVACAPTKNDTAKTTTTAATTTTTAEAVATTTESATTTTTVNDGDYDNVMDDIF